MGDGNVIEELIPVIYPQAKDWTTANRAGSLRLHARPAARQLLLPLPLSTEITGREARPKSQA